MGRGKKRGKAASVSAMQTAGELPDQGYPEDISYGDIPCWRCEGIVAGDACHCHFCGVNPQTPGDFTLTPKAMKQWKRFIELHSKELGQNFDIIGQYLREGDTEGLSKFLQRNAEAQADEMMHKAGLVDETA